MDRLNLWFHENWGISPQVQDKLLATLTVIMFLWFVRFAAQRFWIRRTGDVKIRYRLTKTMTYVVVILGFALVGHIWLPGVESVATYLGLLSAGLAIALKDLIANLAAWAFILWRRPFEVGDRIQIGDHRGDVIDLRIFQFTLLEIGNWVDADQSTGRVIHLPNGMVFQLPLANYSRGFKYIWNEIPVLLTFESNWQAAKEILERLVSEQVSDLVAEAERKLQEAANKFMIFYKKLTPKVYTTVKDSGVLLTIRYLCDPRSRRGTEERLWEAILREFAARDDIDFAYPTQRLYFNQTEGKSGARAPGGPWEKPRD